jgi:multidrug efflux pump
VVDDAIVVLENIYRHIEEGMQPMAAAIQGTKEVGFAVIAMTLTLAAVFTPVAFTTGRTGRLFIEFALTLAGAVIISGFVALSLTPMMCSRLLRHEARPNVVSRGIESFLLAMTRAYARLLAWSLKLRWLVVLLGLAVGAYSYVLWKDIKKELAPLEDRATMLAIFSGPEGSSIDYSTKYARNIEAIAQGIPEVDRIFAISGTPIVSQGLAFVRMKDWEQRSRRVPDILKELQPKLLSIPGVLAFAVAPGSFGASPRERPINFVVMTGEPYEKLQEVVAPFVAELQRYPGLLGVDTDLRLNKPEVRLLIDRDRAADAGVQIDAIGRTMETLLGGRQVTRFKLNGEQYDVMVQLDPSDRSSPNDINGLFVKGRGDAMIPLSSLLAVNETVGPRELNHFSQRRAVTITANLAPGVALGDALTYMENTAQKYLRPGFTIDYNGLTREFKLSSATLFVTFGLALCFIYLVLAGQFESFIDPLIIIMSVPLSMTGALALLQWTGGSLNVYSQIGLITLVGLITKHGILIVEFANQIRDNGKDLVPAVIEAASMRLRPILMTTGAMVLGAVPLALATGAGAESRIQIGMVIVGGMSFGTLLTLFVVPSVYTIFARKRKVHPPSVAASGLAAISGSGH